MAKSDGWSNLPGLLVGVRFPLDGKRAAQFAAYAIQFPNHRIEVHGSFVCLFEEKAD